MYKFLLRPLFFLINPEKIHYFTISILKIICNFFLFKKILERLFTYNHPSLSKEVLGIKFSNPVGLAAGFDKDARLIDELSTLGFGFVEIGTLTPLPQGGNDKPRLFRLPEDQAIVNRMGFNNKGVHQAVQRLKKRKSKVIIGGNIGKNKTTPNKEAVKDYLIGFDALYDVVDYFVVNVSSPNTPNLRELQDKEPLKNLLVTLQIERKTKPVHKPILLKIAPDLTDDQLDDIVSIVKDIQLDGLIATNTTISRDKLHTGIQRIRAIGNGGLSGMPLRVRTNHIIRYLRNSLGKQFPIIGVGGIMTPQDAVEKIKAGATLVQVYTGLIYEGPSLVKRINKLLVECGEISTKLSDSKENKIDSFEDIDYLN